MLVSKSVRQSITFSQCDVCGRACACASVVRQVETDELRWGVGMATDGGRSGRLGTLQVGQWTRMSDGASAMGHG